MNVISLSLCLSLSTPNLFSWMWHRVSLFSIAVRGHIGIRVQEFHSLSLASPNGVWITRCLKSLRVLSKQYFVSFCVLSNAVHIKPVSFIFWRQCAIKIWGEGRGWWKHQSRSGRWPGDQSSYPVWSPTLVVTGAFQLDYIKCWIYCQR